MAELLPRQPLLDSDLSPLSRHHQYSTPHLFSSSRASGNFSTAAVPVGRVLSHVPKGVGRSSLVSQQVRCNGGWQRWEISKREDGRLSWFTVNRHCPNKSSSNAMIYHSSTSLHHLQLALPPTCSRGNFLNQRLLSPTLHNLTQFIHTLNNPFSSSFPTQPF